jgi:glycosyltransferase involved in cell wall biosynthesis
MKTDDKFEFRKGIWLLKEKLRILICILYYLPHRTGMQLYVQRISEELVRRGHAVTILSAKHQTDLPTEETINGVRIVRAWAPPIPISRGMVMPSYPAILVRLLREHDVVSLHTPMLETALIAMMARLMGKSIVATHHGDLHLPSGLSNRVIEGIMFILYWIMGSPV